MIKQFKYLPIEAIMDLYIIKSIYPCHDVYHVHDGFCLQLVHKMLLSIHHCWDEWSFLSHSWRYKWKRSMLNTVLLGRQRVFSLTVGKWCKVEDKELQAKYSFSQFHSKISVDNQLQSRRQLQPCSSHHRHNLSIFLPKMSSHWACTIKSFIHLDHNPEYPNKFPFSIRVLRRVATLYV